MATRIKIAITIPATAPPDKPENETKNTLIIINKRRYKKKSLHKNKTLGHTCIIMRTEVLVLSRLDLGGGIVGSVTPILELEVDERVVTEVVLSIVLVLVLVVVGPKVDVVVDVVVDVTTACIMYFNSMRKIMNECIEQRCSEYGFMHEQARFGGWRIKKRNLRDLNKMYHKNTVSRFKGNNNILWFI